MVGLIIEMDNAVSAIAVGRFKRGLYDLKRKEGCEPPNEIQEENLMFKFITDCVECLYDFITGNRE